MSKKDELTVTGQQLVADFQSTMLAVATSQAADYEAKRSEEELLNNLAISSSGGYLNPNNIDRGFGESAARASLDTHIKKIQAEQIKSLSTSQLSEINSKDQSAYKGKKVHVTVLDKEYQPLEAVWFDQQKGYSNSIFKKNSIEGYIEEVSLDKNALILKPKLMRRLFVSDLKFFVVYVINQSTLEPAVQIELV